jgi:PEP-CTERM motif
MQEQAMISKSVSSIALAVLALCAGAAQAQGFANGGFETANSAVNPPGGAQFFAQGWLAAPTGNLAQWSTVAHTGAHSALLTVPNGFGGSTLFQNSIDHGGLPALTAANVGDLPTLSFWAKGDVSTTGNALFAMRYLDGIGNILNGSGNQFFHTQINTNTWTQISFAMPAIPTGTVALFVEMNTAVGPLLDGRVNAVYIDDIMVSGLTAPVPEPETYALMLAGLAGVAAMVRRRRSV